MTCGQAAIFLIIAGTMGLCLCGRQRHDVAAVPALMAAARRRRRPGGRLGGLRLSCRGDGRGRAGG
jgi:hypothetical protein